MIGTCSRGEMDITRRFGRRILGSSPGGSTETKKPALRQISLRSADRSDIPPAGGVAET